MTSAHITDRSTDLRNSPPLSESDCQQLRAWNSTALPYPRTACVPQLVAQQAATNPGNIALSACDEIVTYLNLEERANRLARMLRSIGVEAGSLVAICLPRSAALAVSALGVLKTGAAYVPIDPTYPRERIGWMLNDAQPAVLLTRKHIDEMLCDGPWCTITMDGDWQQIASYPPDWGECCVRPEDVAYVIYTSGSTGRPKGVQITHDNLLNLVFWHQRTFGIEAEDRASQLASPGFDAAVWELWPYLTAGASVHMGPDGIRNDPEAVRDFLIERRITVAFVPTPLAERMIGLEWPKEIPLRALLTGADTLHRYPPAALPFRLVNNYGPTECTVVATSGIVSSNGRRDVSPSIGRPISNVKIYLLDEHREQVPIGAPGEIYIGGASVAKSYLNAPELSAAKFIDNPFDSEPNGRLYRTGDLACYLPDGEIAFLGRIDEQIKIRGFRIEPNEIIAALATNPLVEASYVVARGDAAGDKRLVAYVVPKPGNHPTDLELREFLSAQVPQHMVPDIFVGLDSLPLNASGKVDCAALPAPDDSNSLHTSAYVAPRTAIEQQIAQMLIMLLGVKEVSAEDNFFLLGGHSLLGTQLIARIRQAFGVELNLRSLFDCPSVAALGAQIERLLYVRLEEMSEEEAERFLRSAARDSAVGDA